TVVAKEPNVQDRRAPGPKSGFSSSRFMATASVLLKSVRRQRAARGIRSGRPSAELSGLLLTVTFIGPQWLHVHRPPSLEAGRATVATRSQHDLSSSIRRGGMKLLEAPLSDVSVSCNSELKSGAQVMLESAAQLPVTGVSWHRSHTPPELPCGQTNTRLACEVGFCFSLLSSSSCPSAQTVSINKAINTQEVAVKEKHARNILLCPVNAVLCWKFCHVFHKLLRDGHPNVIKDSMRNKADLSDMSRMWGHLSEGYGKLCSVYLKLLITKMEFHIKNPRFPGNLQMTDRQLEEAGENDVNNFFQLTVEMFDYLECELNLFLAVFSSLDMSRSVSVTAAGQCRLAPLIQVILDCSHLYDYTVKLLFKLHSCLPADTLQGHRDRFQEQFKKLKNLFYRSSNLQYFKRLIQIPQLPEVSANTPPPGWFGPTSNHPPPKKRNWHSLPNVVSVALRTLGSGQAFTLAPALQNPPNFLRASALSEHISPVVVIPLEASSPESENVVETEELVDTDVPAQPSAPENRFDDVFGTSSASDPFNFNNQNGMYKDERDSQIEQLTREVRALKEELESFKMEVSHKGGEKELRGAGLCQSVRAIRECWVLDVPT
ncbi:hypothetical protein Z043_125281, partial [Scleropages formosus]